MTKAKDKKIKSQKKSKMDKIHDKLIEKYEPGKLRYTDDQCIDMLLYVRDACIDHLLDKVVGKINNKGVFIAHEMIERTMRNMTTIGKTAALNHGNVPQKITITFQDDDTDEPVNKGGVLSDAIEAADNE